MEGLAGKVSVIVTKRGGQRGKEKGVKILSGEEGGGSPRGGSAIILVAAVRRKTQCGMKREKGRTGK